MASQLDPLVELLSEFIKMRQSGSSRDDAWHAVLSKCGHLKEQQVKRLLLLAKDWEKREGFKFRHRDSSDVSATMLRPPEGLEQHLAAPAKVAVGQNKTSFLDPKVLEQLEMQAKVGSVIRPLPPQDSAKTNQLRPVLQQQRLYEQTYFGEKSKILMYFRDFPDDMLTIVVPFDGEIVIGRMSPNSVMAPDIDLTPVHAGYYGVSRMHAALQRRDDHILISDLGSANYTRLNGERLMPHEWRMLKNDDQIMFADLLTQIRFKHD